MAGSPSVLPGRIFISYRRQETAYAAGWLFDRLADEFGGDQVFKDVDSIELGDDFVESIHSAVGSCDVLLALIGDEWLELTDEQGRRRIDQPDDFVRVEIEAALARKVRVIPVLVDGARMPRPDELPPNLAPLARRQALELSPSRFALDITLLLNVLQKTLADMRSRPAATGVQPAAGKPRRRVSKRARVLVGAGLGLAGLGAVALLLTGGGSANSEGPSFSDNFSSQKNGWDAAGGERSGNYYTGDGTYRIYTAHSYTRTGYPSSSAFAPTAKNLRITVRARRLSGLGQNSGYGIACRSRGQDTYLLAIWRDPESDSYVASIGKYGEQVKDGFAELASYPASPSGWDLLQADCTTDKKHLVHLALGLNGKRLVEATDGDQPFLSGTAGLMVANGGSNGTGAAEFDDFAVTQDSGSGGG